MNEIEQTVRDWIREIGRAKARKVCIECDEISGNGIYMQAFNEVTHTRGGMK